MTRRDASCRPGLGDSDSDGLLRLAAGPRAAAAAAEAARAAARRRCSAPGSESVVLASVTCGRSRARKP
jgi:hypothetical protein